MSIALLKSIRKFSIQWIPAPSLISGFMKRFPPVTSEIQPMTLWGREKNKKTAGNLLLVCITCKTWFRAPDNSLPHGPHNYSWAYHDTCALRMSKGSDIAGAIMHTSQRLARIYARVGRSRVFVVGADFRDTGFGLYALSLSGMLE